MIQGLTLEHIVFEATDNGFKYDIAYMGSGFTLSSLLTNTHAFANNAAPD